MTEKEFEELKVGDLVRGYMLFRRKESAIVESISMDTGICIARFIKPFKLKQFNDCGNIIHFEPTTTIATVETSYCNLEVVK